VTAPAAGFARLTIDSIAAGGDGVARHEGVVVFVPRTAPGDVVDASVTMQGRFARGRVSAIVAPSPARVEPPCPHYVHDRCGGCQLQHLAYDAQLAAKAGIVRDGFERIGRRAMEPPLVHGSARPWRYRRKLTLAMRRRAHGPWIAGLHPHDAPGWVFDLRDCPITDERVLGTWAEVRAATRLLPPGVTRLRGAVRLLGDGASFVLEGGRRWPQARDFLAAVPSLRALWWVPEGGTRRLVADRRTTAEPGASFVQVNPAMAEALAAHVVARVRAHGPFTVIDAYAGAGDVAATLAAGGIRVSAIELDAEASAWSASRLPAGSRALAGRAEDLLPSLLPADVVLLNPPRAGVDERVTTALAGALAAAPAVSRPRAVVYVSCNPATLARDVGRMSGWRIAHVEAFDMFPQTAHVETVCELVPEAA
jgi:23S rRNA (uracil1939-C5)-methyltransferase